MCLHGRVQLIGRILLEAIIFLFATWPYIHSSFLVVPLVPHVQFHWNYQAHQCPGFPLSTEQKPKLSSSYNGVGGERGFTLRHKWILRAVIPWSCPQLVGIHMAPWEWWSFHRWRRGVASPALTKPLSCPIPIQPGSGSSCLFLFHHGFPSVYIVSVRSHIPMT